VQEVPDKYSHPNPKGLQDPIHYIVYHTV